MPFGWGKKEPTIFDKDQNKRLEAIANTQAILVKNNNLNIEEKKKIWAWINQLKTDNDKLRAHIATLEQTITAMQKVDMEFKQKLAGLASLGQTTTETGGG